jgi:hypothetical protein
MSSGRIVLEGYGRKDTLYFKVLAASFVVGLAVALAVYLLWQFHAVPPQLQGAFNVVALVLCPPYILSYVHGPNLDTAFAMVLTAGTILLANGFLYAGVMSGVYFLFRLRRPSRGD